MNIQHLDLIGMPVTNQQVSLEFYTTMLGFEVRTNMEHFESDDPHVRWIELVPPGASTAIVLAPWENANSRGTIVLVTTDIEADYAELTAKGLNLPPLDHQPWGISTLITDPDGNKLLLQQNSAMSGA
ncbi:MAG: VOC family protein [Roseiflexaceae bacterium]|nr:VOC family protein [Roseiflexaceae bacterium]